MPNMPCKRAFALQSKFLVTGLLLCNQECLVEGLAAAKLLHTPSCLQSGMEKRCCMPRFLAFLVLKCHLICLPSMPAYLWLHFVFLSLFLAQTEDS